MPTLSAQLPPAVTTVVRRTARRRQRLLIIGRLGAALWWGELLFLAAISVDRLIELPPLLRLVLPLATGLVPAAVVVTLLLALRRTRELEALAGEIDQVVTGARDAVRTAVNLSEREDRTGGTVHPFMFGRVLADAARVSGAARPEQVVGWGRTPRVAAAVIVVAALLGGLAAWDAMKMPLLLHRFLNPLGNYPRPSLTEIKVDGPLAQKVTQGNDLTIAARLAGAVAGQCSLHIVEGPAERLVLMTPRPGDRFDTVLKTVEQPFAFFLTAGDGRTARYRVDVAPRPVVQAMAVHYEYPRYTGLKPLAEPVQNREIHGIEGTRVRVEFTVALPVKESALEFPDRKGRIRWDESRTKGSFSFAIERDGPLFLRLVADSGADNRSDAPLRVKMEPDQPPTISLSGIGERTVFYRNDVLQLGYSGGDDFGITDLYLRYAKSGQRAAAQHWSVPLEQGSAKEIHGQFAVPIDALTEQDDTRIEIELVAVDGKGQESATPRTVLQIVSDTPERLLTELVGFQERYLGFLTQSANTLATQAGRLTIVIDGLDANTPLQEAHQRLLQEIRNNLGRVSFPDVVTYQIYDPQFPYTEYPYHSRRKSEDCLTAPVSLLEGPVYGDRLARLSGAKSPKDSLAQLKLLVDSQAAEAQLLQQALADLLHETRLRLIDVLVGQSLEDAAATAQSTQEEAAVLLAQKQEERLKQLQVLTDKVLPQVADDKLKQSFEAFRTAAALPADERRAQLPPALQQIAASLFASTELDGHLGASLEAYYQAHPLAQRVAEAEKLGSRERLQSSLQILMRLRQTDCILNDAELFLIARVNEALLTGDPARMASAAAAATRLTPWALRYGLLDRVRYLEHGLANLERDRELGRLAAGSPGANSRWQDVREVFLSLVRDRRAGHFAAIAAEVDADLGALAKLAPAFRPWDSQPAFTPAGFPAAMAATTTILRALVARLAPVVTRETQDMLPETTELLRDMAARLANLEPKLAAEQQNIANEMAHPREGQGVYKRYTQPFPARMDADREFSRSLSSDVIAFSKALDLRERVALAAPTPETTAALTAMDLLFEYLVQVDEDAYNSTYKLHMDNLYFPSRLYPEYLAEIAKFYAGFGGTATELSGWIQRLADNKGGPLLAEPAFTDLLQRAKNQNRYNATLKTWTEHLDFRQKARTVTDDPGRRAFVAALAQETSHALAYWEELYLATHRTHQLLGTALPAVNAAAWAGLTPETLAGLNAAITAVRVLLPETKTRTDETKQLAETVARLAELAAQAATANVANLKPAARQLLLADLRDGRDRLQTSLLSLQGLLTIPPIQTRTRTETQAAHRIDLFYVLSRVIRNEARWMERVADADRRLWAARAEFMTPQATTRPALDEIDWLVAREQIARRKSAGAQTQSSRALSLDTSGGRAVPPRLPAYLFAELERALKKPYPTQFKEPGLEYLGTLSKDAQ